MVRGLSSSHGQMWVLGMPFWWVKVRCKCWMGHSDLGLDIALKKTYMKASPTTNMKKGWFYRNSCDKKNHEIAPMMMIYIKWWSRSSDDVPVMIQIQWWSRSSDDVPMMIQIQWWSRSEDEDELKMKITWIWRWLEDEDELKMTRTQGWSRWYIQEYLCW